MAAKSLPVIRIENTGPAQQNIPFTFGQVFKAGQIKPGQGLAAKLANGDALPLQVDYKATHADGSARHVIISGILPTLFAKEERELQLVPAQAGTPKLGFQPFIQNGVVELIIAGVKYTTDGALMGDSNIWLDGPIVQEQIVPIALNGSDGKPHPHLSIRAGFRAYSNGQVRVEVGVENTTTFTPGAQNLTYDIAVKLAGKTVFEQKALTHYHHARWRKVFWLGSEPQIHVKPDAPYLMASKAISNYDQNTGVGEAQLASY